MTWLPTNVFELITGVGQVLIVVGVLLRYGVKIERRITRIETDIIWIKRSINGDKNGG